MYTTESHILSAERLTLQLAHCPFRLVFAHMQYTKKAVQSDSSHTPGFFDMQIYSRAAGAYHKKVHKANIIYSHQNVE